jgi:hypothetical protein
MPQGGPDLLADQARAHEDMPFVWWVVDQVFERDRRAQWLRLHMQGDPSVSVYDGDALVQEMFRIHTVVFVRILLNVGAYVTAMIFAAALSHLIRRADPSLGWVSALLFVPWPSGWGSPWLPTGWKAAPRWTRLPAMGTRPWSAPPPWAIYWSTTVRSPSR